MILTAFDRDTVRSLVYEMLKEGLEVMVNDVSHNEEKTVVEVKLTLTFSPEGKGKYKQQAFSKFDTCEVK